MLSLNDWVQGDSCDRLISAHSLALCNTALKINRAIDLYHSTVGVTTIRWCINFSENARIGCALKCSY